MKILRTASCAAIASLVFGTTCLLAQSGSQVIEAMPPHHLTPRPTVELAPKSAWAADFAADNCSLTRTFGDDSGSVTLRLRQFAPGPSLEVTLASQTFELQPYKPRYAFAAAAPVEIHSYRSFDSSVHGMMFNAPRQMAPTAPDTRLPFAAEDPVLRAADRLTVQNVFDRNLVLRTGSLAQPLTVLATCLDNLMTSWGLDAAAQHSLTRPVTEKDEDRPWPGPLTGAGVVTEWRSDQMDFVLLVGETGQVGECRLVGGLPDDGPLAERICAAMPRDWQFVPALDAQGQPIRSYHRATMLKSTRRTVASF